MAKVKPKKKPSDHNGSQTNGLGGTQINPKPAAQPVLPSSGLQNQTSNNPLIGTQAVASTKYGSDIEELPPISKGQKPKKPKYGKTGMFPAFKKKPVDSKFISPYQKKNK